MVNIKITDENEYQKYLRHADEVFTKYKGRYLAVDDDPLVLEGKWDYSRAVLIKFESRVDFNAWYYSVEYQEILKFRISASECDSILFEDD